MIQDRVGTCCVKVHSWCEAKQRAKTTQVSRCTSTSVSFAPSITSHKSDCGAGTSHQPPAASRKHMASAQPEKGDVDCQGFTSRHSQHPGHHFQIIAFFPSLRTGPRALAQRPSPHPTAAQAASRSPPPCCTTQANAFSCPYLPPERRGRE